MPKAGQIIRALDFTDPASDSQGNNGTTTSTSFTATLSGSTAAGCSFVAPTSGRVLVSNQCRLVNSGANETLCGWSLKTGDVVGSGSEIYSAADDRSAIHVGTSVERQGNSLIATGLVAGDSYNVQQQFRVSAGTGTFAYRYILVIPLP